MAGTLGHQDDREHLRPSGHTPQAFHRQQLGTSVAAIEAVKNKKRQILSNLTLLLTLTAILGPSGESRTHGLLNPIQARYQTALHPVTRGLAVTSRYYYTRRSQKVKGESSKKFNFFEDSVFCVLPLCVLDRPEVPDAAGNRKGKSGRLGDPERIPYPRNAPQPAKSPGQGQQQNQLTQQ